MASADLPPPMPLYNVGSWSETDQPQQTDPVPPQTGTTLPFIWPPPEHLQSPPGFDEPVLPFPPAESLLARETELDALRCEEPSKYEGKQVYDSLQPPPHNAYTRAQGPTRAEDMPRWYVLDGPHDDTLLFESRFESGNLRSAEKIDASEYNLHLAFDINTDRHTQWFYFRMSNLRKGRRYKLNMQNLMKTESVYNLGMQPLVYSEVRAEREGVGWHRTGSDACYFKNQLSRAKAKPFWTLTFCVETEYENDTIYLAHCFPYRYTDLQRYLSEMEASALGRSNAIRRRTLCRTLAGNDCDMLTITSPSGDHAFKKGIVISARVHPGETNASWMMKGVLDYLASDSLQAVALRDKFVLKIVPMLNPDGVIVGNYRCSLAGGDLNRQYEDPKRELFPEVLNLKQMIANFGMGKEVMLYVDLHGHSKKSNIFMYGVENPTDEVLYMRERVIPTLLDRASPLFSFRDCSFDVGKGKEGCGRVVVRKQLGIVNAYTMEASFMGADQGTYQGLHFNQGHFESMGHALCEILIDLVDPTQTKVEQIAREFREMHPIDLSRVVARCDESNDKGGASDDSDSDASVKLSAKPSRGNTTRDITAPPTITGGHIRGTGVGKKSPRGSDSGQAGSSDSDSNSVRCGGKNSKETRESSKRSDKRTGSSKAQRNAVAVATAAAVTTTTTPKLPSGGLSGPALNVAQKPPPAKPPTPKSAKSVNSSAKSVAPKGVAMRRNSGAKSASPTGAAAKAIALAGGAAGPKTMQKTRSGSVGWGDRSEGNAAAGRVLSAGSRGGGSAGAKHSKGAAASGAPTAGGKKGGSSNSGSSARGQGGTKNIPPRIPTASVATARRPASSPATRSLSSPRRKSVARAAERSPSAPPKTTSASRRAGGTGSAVSGAIGGSGSNAKKGGNKVAAVVAPSKGSTGKRGGTSATVSGSGSSSSSGKPEKGKGKGEQKKAQNRPLPPLRSKSSTAKK